MPKSDRSGRKKSRRSRRAEAEQAELVAAADEEEGTAIEHGGEDDAQNLRARRVAILGVSVWIVNAPSVWLTRTTAPMPEKRSGQ